MEVKWRGEEVGVEEEEKRRGGRQKLLQQEVEGTKRQARVDASRSPLSLRIGIKLIKAAN